MTFSYPGMYTARYATQMKYLLDWDWKHSSVCLFLFCRKSQLLTTFIHRTTFPIFKMMTKITVNQLLIALNWSVSHSVMYWALRNWECYIMWSIEGLRERTEHLFNHLVNYFIGTQSDCLPSVSRLFNHLVNCFTGTQSDCLPRLS